MILIIALAMILPILSCEESSITVPEDLVIHIEANPRNVEPGTSEYDPTWGKTTITARVVNTSLVPIQGIGVIFSAAPSGIFESSWEPMGNSRKTNSNGRASDVLHTDSSTTITASVKDITAEINIGFAGQNILPNATIIADPNPAKVSKTVVFDASSSSDTDGVIVNYQWILNPDLDPPEVVEGPDALTLIRTYQSEQNIEVILTVEDDDGATDSDSTIEEIVNNLPPIADAGGSQTVKMPVTGIVTVYLDHSRSYDPDGVIVRVQWCCDFDSEGICIDLYDVPMGESYGVCTYDEVKNYFPEVTVWDDGPVQKFAKDQTIVSVVE